jgi:hypothetical protein
MIELLGLIMDIMCNFVGWLVLGAIVAFIYAKIKKEKFLFRFRKMSFVCIIIASLASVLNVLRFLKVM